MKLYRYKKREQDLQTISEPVTSMTGRRSTGHQGTGYYFVSKPYHLSENEYKRRLVKDHAVLVVDSSFYNLWQSDFAWETLYESSKFINNYIYRELSLNTTDINRLSQELTETEKDLLKDFLSEIRRFPQSLTADVDLEQVLQMFIDCSNDDREQFVNYLVRNKGFEGIMPPQRQAEDFEFGVVLYDLKQESILTDEFLAQDAVLDEGLLSEATVADAEEVKYGRGQNPASKRNLMKSSTSGLNMIHDEGVINPDKEYQQNRILNREKDKDATDAHRADAEAVRQQQEKDAQSADLDKQYLRGNEKQKSKIISDKFPNLNESAIEYLITYFNTTGGLKDNPMTSFLNTLGDRSKLDGPLLNVIKVLLNGRGER